MTLPCHDFIKLSTGKESSTLTIELVVNFPACVIHFVGFTGVYLFRTFLVIHPLTIMELHQLSNNRQKLLFSDISQRIFIHQCMIG